MERAFSRVYSLPEGGLPEARAASNRALWRESVQSRLQSHGGWTPRSARRIQQSALERAFSRVYSLFQRAAAPKRAPHPTERSGEGV